MFFFFVLEGVKVGEQSFEQCLVVIKIYEEPNFQSFLNQRMIGSGSLGDEVFRIREPLVLVMSKPLKTPEEWMLFTKALGKNWQQVPGSYLDGFFCNKFENNNSYGSEHHSFMFL